MYFSSGISNDAHIRANSFLPAALSCIPGIGCPWRPFIYQSGIKVFRSKIWESTMLIDTTACKTLQQSILVAHVLISLFLGGLPSIISTAFQDCQRACTKFATNFPTDNVGLSYLATWCFIAAFSNGKLSDSDFCGVCEPQGWRDGHPWQVEDGASKNSCFSQVLQGFKLTVCLFVI